MNYELSAESNKHKAKAWATIRSLLPMLAHERGILVFAALATVANSLVNLTAPLLIAHIVDTYITQGQFEGLMNYALILLLLYLAGLFTSYAQTRLMGGVGQRFMFNVRTRIFTKLQELPVAFFHANKTGDLISRINNDTDKLNMFFSQTLVQFMGSVVIMTGAAVFLMVIQTRLGTAALLPAVFLLLFTRAVSPWVKQKNADSMAATGALSGEVTESLQNFKVIVAFNRRDFFRKRFTEANSENYRQAIKAGIANNLFTPVFNLCSKVAQLAVLVYGIHLITAGELTLGLLIGYLAYVTNFYNPLQQLAALWANFQVALASWDRIASILNMKNDLVQLPAVSAESAEPATNLLEFRDVSFAYTADKYILKHLNIALEAGKTYALVGPTGGGKTTTASLMARLYDPVEGTVYLNGVDIRHVDSATRAQKIGFILQDPILFSGTVRDNILYGNAAYAGQSNEKLLQALKDAGLDSLLARFDGGLEAEVATSGDALSLGQKQLIAFMRAVLRNPDLLILDEATANIDTVTEQMLEAILKKLPGHTTVVVIAHRLNTIENADEIFFVNGTSLTRAGSMEEAVAMLLHQDEKHMS